MSADAQVSRPEEKRVTGLSGNGPGQGPFMLLHLVVVDGLIRQASYETYQCPSCHDCGKALCDLVRGKPLAMAHSVTWETLQGIVGPLPRNRSHCIGLAVVALAQALKELEKL